MTRLSSLLGITLVCWTSAAAAQSTTLDVGDQRLTLASQATRSELFGFVDLYEIALYVPKGASGVRALREKSTAKGLSIDVLYNGSLPDNIPSGWTEELQPVLSRSQQQELRRAYARLRPHDEIRIVYTSDVGTHLSVSGKTVLNVPGHELMLAFLDIWLGQTPVSEDIKEELLSGW